MKVTTRFTDEMMSLAKSYCDDSEETAAPEGGGSFAEYAMVSLHEMRIFFDETCEMTIDRLEVVQPIWRSSGLSPKISLIHRR